MKIKNLFFALLALPLFFVACDENKDVDQVKDPTVKVTAMSTTETSVQFVITSTDATKVAYLVVEGSDVPNAAEILTNGKTADANVNIIIKEEGLKESTEYVVAVAAQNNKATVRDFITMTTKTALNPDGPGDEPDQPGDEPDQPGDTNKVEFTATHITTEYQADGSLHYYYFELGDNTWNGQWGVDGGTYYSFGIVSATKGNGVLPNGTYSLASSYSANTIIDDFSFRYQMQNGDMVNGMETFKDANLVITDGKIEANIEMPNGEIHHVVFEGALTVGDGGTDVPVEFEATHTADKWYWGGDSNYGNKYMVSGEGFSIDVHFPAQEAEETTLTPQLYTWVETTMFGTTDLTAEVPYHFTTRTFTVNGTSVAVDDGTALVEAEDDVYHIEMTLQGRDGFTYMIEYNGKLNDKGEVSDDKEPISVVLTTFEYKQFFDSYYIHEYDFKNENGDRIYLYVNYTQVNDKRISSGTYTWYKRSDSGYSGRFSTQYIKVGGVDYKNPVSGTLVVADTENLDLTINLTMEDGSEMRFTYVEEANEGGSTEPAEPTKLATPSVSGIVAGNAATVSWQKIEGAKDYTVTLNGTDVQNVTTTYITYSNLEYETTYSVSVVANTSDEALYITSDAGTATFTTEAESAEGGNEGGNTGGENYENWNYSAHYNTGTNVITLTGKDDSRVITVTTNDLAFAKFYADTTRSSYFTNVTVDGVATTDVTSESYVHVQQSKVTIELVINGVTYTGDSNSFTY